MHLNREELNLRTEEATSLMEQILTSSLKKFPITSTVPFLIRVVLNVDGYIEIICGTELNDMEIGIDVEKERGSTLLSDMLRSTAKFRDLIRSKLSGNCNFIDEIASDATLSLYALNELRTSFTPDPAPLAPEKYKSCVLARLSLIGSESFNN